MPSRVVPQHYSLKSQGGVLPISAVIDKPSSRPATAIKGTHENTSWRGLKLVLRRLPPGLTEEEFSAALGQEWRPGRGKVTWTCYKPGKISKDLSQPSRPARAYIHTVDQNHANLLSLRVAQADFTDARGSTNDSVLIGTPTLGVAPYGRVPSGKRRHDARQGTIDQDPEFIAFLESLTNPITKPKPFDSTEVQKEQPAAVTPLIQHLRDKKAAREKTASMKAAAKQQKQDVKADALVHPPGLKPPTAGKEQPAKKAAQAQAGKVAEKATIEAGRKPAREDKPPASVRLQNTSPVKPIPARNDVGSKRPEGRIPGSAVARMIQRDLGIRAESLSGPARVTKNDKPGSGARSITPNGQLSPRPMKASPAPNHAAKPSGKSFPPAAIATNQAASQPSSSQTSISANEPVIHGKLPTGPKATLPVPPRQPKPSAISPGATQAFLKHANPSQGITEALLETALTQYGKTVSVEIDKRKGFAYVEFAAPSGLQAAITASPIAVAQGSVQVLERKDLRTPLAGSSTPPVANQAFTQRGHYGGIGPTFRGGARGGRGRGAAFGRAVDRPVPQGNAGSINGNPAVSAASKLAANAAPPNVKKSDVP